MIINADHDKEAVKDAHDMAKKHGLKVMKVTKNNVVMSDKTLGEETIYTTQIHEAESLTKGMKLVSKHGEGTHTAKVYYHPDWEEHQVHYYKDGKHMGEGPVSYHSGNGKKEDKKEAQESAEHGVKLLNAKKK